MIFQNFKVTNKTDENDYMIIYVDMDSIDDDEPTVMIMEESLPHNPIFLEDYATDDLFLQCCWDMISDIENVIPRLERVEYVISLM